ALHAGPVAPGVEAAVEARRVEADLAGVALQVPRGERALVAPGLPLEKEVVVAPELALLGRALRGLGGEARLRSEERHVAVDQAGRTRRHDRLSQSSPWT